MTNSYVFYLGAKDPEMNRIESILSNGGYEYFYAHNNGELCNPGTAYSASPVTPSEGSTPVFVECEPTNSHDLNYINIDHHRPGDFGYSLTSSQYWEASSLGQLWSLLYPNTTPSHDDKLLAAMDHCFGDALFGNCPGIDKSEVLYLKLENISKGTNHTLYEVKETLYRYVDVLSKSSTVQINSEFVIDITDLDLGVGYSVDVLTVQLASIMMSKGVLYKTADKNHGRQKLVLNGQLNFETVQYFMEHWGPNKGLTNIYGNPYRKYAGGYF